MRRIQLALPGRLDRRTGGTIYDRRIVQGLRGMGWGVEVHEMPGTYPFADATARASAASVLAANDGSPLVIDGLALPAFDLASSGGRVVALVHHPLAEETGLSPDDAATLRRAEQADLGRVAGIIVTSPFTARALVADYGVPAGKVEAILPGVDPVQRQPRRVRPDRVRLLSVAAFVPRKGHRVLFEALTGIADLSWSLLAIGATDRDPDLAVGLRHFLAEAGLADRVAMPGEVSEEALAAAYGAADVFVHPAHYEGYGMALGEALRAGLPVVAARGGAVPDTVPEQAGLLVPPGDGRALAAALRRVVGDHGLRAGLAEGAIAAGDRLPGWDDAARAFAAAVRRFAG